MSSSPYWSDPDPRRAGGPFPPGPSSGEPTVPLTGPPPGPGRWEQPRSAPTAGDPSALEPYDPYRPVHPPVTYGPPPQGHWQSAPLPQGYWVPTPSPFPSGAVAGQPVLWSDKSKAVAALLAFFLGTLGIHNFYLGHVGRGVAQLLVTLALGWTGVGLIGVGIWVLIEFVLILTGGIRDRSGRLLR